MPAHPIPDIKAVVFDFGGVLCFPPPHERFDPLAREFGLTTSDLLRIFWSHRLPYDAGQLDAHAYWSKVAEEAGGTLDQARLPALVRHEVELWNDFDERVLSWASHLQARGIKTAVLSNLPQPLGEELRATAGFLDPFDHHTFSYELKMVKPQAEIYHHALEGLGVKPEEALFLDDRPENVAGARAVGMHSEIFSSWEFFLEDALERYALPAPAREA
ncbi:MAG TPA: HAD family phosphatase [Bryobacteraceae bacterium]